MTDLLHILSMKDRIEGQHHHKQEKSPLQDSFPVYGITPSATGGQPMQLYYMSRDDNRLSESSVVLMTVALIYKLVLVLIGIAALVFWQKPLRVYLA